jgi:hypothetical protein
MSLPYVGDQGTVKADHEPFLVVAIVAPKRGR